jgi:hypothetical protein
MTTPNTGIGAITLRTMRARLDEAAAIARAAEGLVADGQPGRALTIAFDVEPLAIDTNQLLACRILPPGSIHIGTKSRITSVPPSRWGRRVARREARSCRLPAGLGERSASR